MLLSRAFEIAKLSSVASESVSSSEVLSGSLPVQPATTRAELTPTSTDRRVRIADFFTKQPLKSSAARLLQSASGCINGVDSCENVFICSPSTVYYGISGQ